jgi:hypothetical protein
MTQGFSGATIVIPEIPPDAGDDGGSFNQPPVVIPPLPTVTPSVSGGSGTIAIYDNGEFIMNANAINFIGSIVHVVPYTISGSARADVFFDACGCSGTFADFGTNYGLLDTNGAVCRGAYWTGTSAYYCYGYSVAETSISTGYFTVSSGTSYTLLAEYTGLYDIDFDFSAALSPTTSNRDFTYTITLHLGNKYTQVFSGTYVGSGGTFLTAQQVTAHNIFLQSGESMLWYIEYSVTDNNPPNLGNAQLCFAIDGCTIDAVTQ